MDCPDDDAIPNAGADWADVGVVPNNAGVDCAAVEADKPKEALKGAGEGAEEAVGVNPKPAVQAVS